MANIVETQPSSPCTYMTAPTSPIDCTTDLYHSAPVSPRLHPTEGRPAIPSPLDDFEFKTSGKFGGFFDYYGGQNGKIAFADELFLDGHVMPLKPPPRLLHDYDLIGPASPPRPTLCRMTFSKRTSWRNDDFDPFMAALQKVTEEKRRGRAGGGAQQRRSSSYSPFRAVERCSSDCTHYADRDFLEESGNACRAWAGGPSLSGPLVDFKGSAYARWVREQTGGGGLRPGKSPRKSILGDRVRPMKNDQERTVEQAQPEEISMGKLQRLKEFLKKYAVFGKGSRGTKTGSEKKKPSNYYYNKLGFKSKENGEGYEK